MRALTRLSIVTLLTGLFVAVTALANAQSADERAIRDAIAQHYFQAHATGSGQHLAGWFVPEGRMMSIQNGQLRVVPSETYIGGFSGKPAPDEAQRRRRVLAVDVTGDAAVAKVELDYPTTRLVDYFQLLKVNGEWRLVNKIFTRQPK